MLAKFTLQQMGRGAGNCFSAAQPAAQPTPAPAAQPAAQPAPAPKPAPAAQQTKKMTKIAVIVSAEEWEGEDETAWMGAMPLADRLPQLWGSISSDRGRPTALRPAGAGPPAGAAAAAAAACTSFCHPPH